MSTPSLSDQRQIDIVCDQFENQWDANRRPNFNSFTDLVDDTLREALLHMLLEIDIDLRTRAKHPIEVADYHTAGEAASLYVRELLEKKNTSEDPILCTDSPEKPGHSPTRTINPEFDETHHNESEYKEDDANFEVCMPIRKGDSTGNIEVRELAGGTCISLVHTGPYDQIGPAYDKITEFARQQGYEIKVPTREVYLKGPGMILKGNPRKYVTEIQMLIAESATP